MEREGFMRLGGRRFVVFKGSDKDARLRGFG